MPNGYTAQLIRCLACILLLLQVYLRLDLTLFTRLIVLDRKCSEGVGRIDMFGSMFSGTRTRVNPLPENVYALLSSR
jgi:hypothetical protein